MNYAYVKTKILEIKLLNHISYLKSLASNAPDDIREAAENLIKAMEGHHAAVTAELAKLKGQE